MINSGKVTLNSFNTIKVPGTNNIVTKRFDYTIKHNNGNNTLEQTLTIDSVPDSMHTTWIAEMSILGFPEDLATPSEAALKLADWFERMANAIRCGDYLELPDNNFVDINDPASV